MKNLRPTTEKINFFENVEFNVTLLTELVPLLEIKFNDTKDPIKKANVMMELLKAESLLHINSEMLN